VLAATCVHAQSGVIDLLGSSGAGRNVTTPSPGPPVLAPMSRPVDPAEYVVGPGDALQVVLSGTVTRSWDAMVLPEGALFVPSVGSIPVTGLTLLDARRVVLQRLSSEYRGITLELRLLRPRTLLIFLAGETTRPGPLEVSAASRTSEVLSEAMLSPAASRRNIELRRRTPGGDVRIRIDLIRLRLTGHIPQDPPFREGDLVYMPISRQPVVISGAIGRAGQYELAPGDSLSTLIAFGGGPTADATDEATMVRFRDDTHSDSSRFKVSDVLAGRFDLSLQEGDRVFVYYKPHYHYLEQATIVGDVGRPGPYPLAPGGTRLSELVGAAGGFLPTADLASLRVFRSSGLAGGADPEIDRLAKLSRREMTTSEYEGLLARLTARREDFRVDWNRLKREPELDFTLSGGDVVRVDPVVAAIQVDGQVRHPGLIVYKAGRKVDEYVQLAGGFSERASRGQVRVKRAGTGQMIMARDVKALQPGDLVWVPEHGEPETWQHLQTALLLAAQVATVVLALRLF
jgi:protein involved in polysaccharide export with SLBB domain